MAYLSGVNDQGHVTVHGGGEPAERGDNLVLFEEAIVAGVHL